MKITVKGDILPYGLSRRKDGETRGTYYFRLPVWAKYANRYQVINDQFISKRWVFVLIFCFVRYKYPAVSVRMSWGWA